MKKLFSLTFLSFLVFNGYSQMEVKENVKKDSVVWSPWGTPIPKLKHYYNVEDDYYMFFYQNPKYQHITDIESIYIGDKEETLKFFRFLMDMKRTNKKYDMKLGYNNYEVEDVPFGNSTRIRIYDKKDRVFCYMNYTWIKKIIKVLTM